MIGSWDDLRFVLAIADARSLSGAADALGVNASTAYRRLNQIEETLGVRLFDRQPDGYAPTAAGEEAAARARQMAEAADALDRAVSGRDAALSGTIRVTLADTIAEYLVMPMLADFRVHYPDITLEVAVNNDFLSLARREADVAIRPTRMPQGDAVGRRVSDIGFALYGRDGAAPAPETAPFVGFDDALAHLAAAEWISANVAPARIAMRCNTIPAQISAVEAGLGIGLLPCFAAASRPGLTQLGPPIPSAGTGLWLLTHRDLRTAARIRAFLDHIGAGIRALRPVLEGRDGTTHTQA